MPFWLLTGLAVSVMWFAASQRLAHDVKPVVSDEPALRHDAERDDDGRFIYEVLERALWRTVDGNRYVDMLLLGVLATDTALLVLVLEKSPAHWSQLLAAILAAAAIASAALLLSLFVRDAPRPNLFLSEATADARRARQKHVAAFVVFAERNDRIQTVKQIVFVCALLILFASSLAVTVRAMVESVRTP